MLEFDVSFQEKDKKLDVSFDSASKNLNVEFQNLHKVSEIGELPVASQNTLGGIKVGENLKMSNGVLSVDTANQVEQDNTKPVTSAAVHVQIGNIAVLLANI